MRDRKVLGSFALVVFVAVAGWALAQHFRTEHGLPAPHVVLGKPEVVLPMLSFHGRPVVEVMLEGRGPYRFVLDTGASGTVLAESLAAKLELPSLGNARVGSQMGNSGTGRLVKIGRLDLPGASLSEVLAVATDLGRVFGSPDDPVGVLSATGLFPGYLVTFDYPRARVVLREGELPPPDGADVVVYDFSRRLPMLRIQVAGVELDALLDTGSERGLTLPAAYADRLPLAGKPAPAGTGRMVDKEFEIRAARLEGAVRIGRHAIDRPLVHFVEGKAEGNVGYEILRRFSLTFDAKNRRLKIEGGS
jgi:predicted aspartyl protease